MAHLAHLAHLGTLGTVCQNRQKVCQNRQNAFNWCAKTVKDMFQRCSNPAYLDQLLQNDRKLYAIILVKKKILYEKKKWERILSDWHTVPKCAKKLVPTLDFLGSFSRTKNTKKCNFFLNIKWLCPFYSGWKAFLECNLKVMFGGRR